MRLIFALAGVFGGLTLLLARTGEIPPKPDDSRFEKGLSKDQEILHALNRLTFGPRPGDVAAVKKLGLKRWIDLQLHPERIAENPELERLLQPLATLRMTPAEIVAAYPPPQLIRAVALGRQPLPQDPLARAAVERQVARIDARRQVADDEPLPPRVPLTSILTLQQIQMLRSGSIEQKRAVLHSIPAAKQDDFVIALSQIARNRRAGAQATTNGDANSLRNQLLAAAGPDLRRKLMLANNPEQVVAADLAEGKLYRAIYSNRQLEEVMADFWYNHFNVDWNKGADRFLTASYERDAIRPYALGKFRNLLGATATSPAMLFYLDNWQSRAGKLNENYARELMELHTLGVDGGYTQHDIIEVARCFTGWTIQQPNRGGTFVFNGQTHDNGEKTVLGVTIPAGGGQEDGEKVLDILARHPSTARFISRELAQRFVADDPPPMLIERMAQTFTDTDGDIRAVLKTMFQSKEFFSQGAYRAKMKTPFEMIVSAARAAGAKVDWATPLANQLSNWGEPLYRKLEPTGYSNLSPDWVNSSALLDRMNFAIELGQNHVQGTEVNPKRFSSVPSSAARELLFTNGSPQTLAALNKAEQEQKKKAPHAAGNPGLIAGLVIGSPDFQRK